MGILRLLTALILLLPFVVACSDKAQMVSFSREPEYYEDLTNSAAEAPKADQNVENLKMIQTGTDYPMRYILFDNNTFYYQIDRLGNGYGTWKHENGGLELTATRPIFDLKMYVSATKKEGDELVVKFIDRFGFNSIKASPRVPTGAATKPLDKFTESDKGI